MGLEAWQEGGLGGKKVMWGKGGKTTAMGQGGQIVQERELLVIKGSISQEDGY